MSDTKDFMDEVQFDADGLCPAIVQDAEGGDVLMMAYMNEDALRQTLDTGRMTYWSRSRGQLWVKGEKSGNRQDVRAVYVDCDGDALLFEVDQAGGAACHTGHRSCFYRRYDDGEARAAGERVFDPEVVYGEKS